MNALNAALGNIGKTVDLARPSLQRRGDDEAMAALVEKMNRGDVHALFMLGVNPAYDYHRLRASSAAWKKLLSQFLSLIVATKPVRMRTRCVRTTISLRPGEMPSRWNPISVWRNRSLLRSLARAEHRRVC